MLNHVRKIYGGRMRYASNVDDVLSELTSYQTKLTETFQKQKEKFEKGQADFNKHSEALTKLVEKINSIAPADVDRNNLAQATKNELYVAISEFLRKNDSFFKGQQAKGVKTWLWDQAQKITGTEDSSPEGGEGDAAGDDEVASDEDEPEEMDEDPAEIEKKTKAIEVLGKACDQYVQEYNDESSFKRVWDPIYSKINEIRGDAVSYLSDIAKYGKNVNNFFKDFGEASKNISAISKSNENVSKKESDILAVLDNDTESIDRSVTLAERIKKAIADETPLSDEADEIKNFVRWIDNLIPLMSSVSDALRRI